MAITAEPIFIESITRGSGVVQRLTTVTNQSDQPVHVVVEDIPQLPEWVELEDLTWGTEIKLPPNESRDFVVVINSNHQFFPETESHNDQVKIVFRSQREDAEEFETIMPVFLPRIIQEIPAFQGIFALDFGTTNSCYAFRKPLKLSMPGQGSTGTEVSTEIPSILFFKDVTGSPLYVIGSEAKREMKLNPAKTYAYFLSVKRLLGVNKKRPFMVIDASPNTHHKQFNEVELCAFLIRGLLQMAQDQIGERITRLYATFPTLFSRPRKEALEEALRLALEQLNGAHRVPKDAVTLEIDEACAAAFGAVYQQIQDSMGLGDVQDFRKTLLAYDAGGGTTDIALLDVSVERQRSGRVIIHQHVRGLSGDSYYGGDNVTLEVFKLLKMKAAYMLAQHKLNEEKQAAAAQGAGDDDDLWGGGGSSAAQAADPVKDVWAASQQEPEPDTQEENTASVFYDEGLYKDACQTILDWAPALRAQVTQGLSMADAVQKQIKDESKPISGSEVDGIARRVQAAVDLIVPTRWTHFATHNEPRRERLARQLFFELWNEADRMKVHCVVDPAHKAHIEGPLALLAGYSRVEPEFFHEITIELHEIESAIAADIRDTVQKAYGLLTRADEEQEEKTRVITRGEGLPVPAVGESTASGTAPEVGAGGGLLQMPGAASGSGGGLLIGGPLGGSSGGPAVGGGAIGGTKPVRVLLAGNSSKLPIIKRTFCEVFGKTEDELFSETSTGKASVKSITALGCCEVASLSRAFGKGGLITLESRDFTERCPFAIGLWHPELRLVGFENGFMPLFKRGSRPFVNLDGDQAPNRLFLDSETYFLIHDEMLSLEIYSDYRDGGLPLPLGLFDLSKPEADLTQAEHDQCYELIEHWCARNNWRKDDPDRDPPFGFLIELTPDWSLKLIDPKKNFVYHLQSRQDSPNPMRMPFNGLH